MSTERISLTGRTGLAMLVLALGCSSCTHPNIETLTSFRTAKKAGDYDTANSYMASDSRIWFNKKEGPGNPWSAKGGPYKHWDKEFNSTSIKKDLRAHGDTVTYISYETNDFYRMIDHQATPARVTYYFNDEGLITGMLYAGLASGKQRPPDRRGEFDRWADKKYPGLLESPEMKIPNQPKRWRELLTEWRAEVGLPPIE